MALLKIFFYRNYNQSIKRVMKNRETRILDFYSLGLVLKRNILNQVIISLKLILKIKIHDTLDRWITLNSFPLFGETK